MATPQEELAELNRQIADLKRQLGDTSEFVPLQNLKDAQRLFTALKRDVSEIGDSLSYVAQAFRDSVAELSKQNTELNNSRSALKSISNISQKILVTRSLDGDISTKELASLEKRAKLQFKSLELAVKSGRLRGDALKEAQDALKQEQKFFDAVQGIRKEQEEIGKNSGVRLFTGLEEISNAIPGLNKFTSAFKDASTAAKEQARFNKAAYGDSQGLTKEKIKQNKAANAVSDQIKSQLSELKKAEGLDQEKVKNLGLQNLLVDKNGKTLAGTAAIAKANSLVLKESLPTTANTITPLKAGFQALGPIVSKALGPLALLKLLVDALKSTDKLTGDLAKSLGTSYTESLGMVRSMSDIATQSRDTFVTTEGLVKAQMQLSTALGTNVQLNSQLLVDYTKLTEQAGYSVESATLLGKVSLATGQTTKNITSDFLGQAKALNLSNNLALNEKQLLESVAKTSKGTLATFAAKPKELANAVFEAKKLGLEISQVEKIADGLLDIEQSLTAEFEAEVITGKQLNLERARYFALTNDIAGVAEELGKQGVTQASFAESSRIEQQAVAAAMGMSRDELGEMLILQEGISKAGVKDEKKAREKFEILKAQYGEAEAIRRLGDTTFAQQLASQSAQERFNKTVSKLKDIFVSLAEPVLAIISPFADLVNTIMPALNVVLTPVIDVFRGIADIVNSILDPTISLKQTFEEMGPITSFIAGALVAAGVAVTASLVPGLVRAGVAALMSLPTYISMAIAAVTTASATTLGIGAIAIAGGIAAVIASMNSAKSATKAGDIMSPADGKTQISTKEGGLFELSPNDDVAAAPGLLDNLKGNGIDKKISTPTPQESQPLEIRGLDKLLSAFSIQPSKQLELNQTSSPIQPLGREIEPSLPTSAPLPERGLERNIPAATTVAIDYDKLANAIAMGAERGTAKAKLNVNLDGNAVANNLQTPMAMGARRYSV